jgi:hypothetical protein
MATRSKSQKSRPRRATSVFELIATAQELTTDDKEVVRLVAQLLSDSKVRLTRGSRRVAAAPDAQMARLAA